MKKLMIAAAIVCAAAFANAASIAWGFGGAETRNTDGKYFNDAGTPDATAFLFFGAVTVEGGQWKFGKNTDLITYANMNDDYAWGATNVTSTDGMFTYDAAAGQAITIILLDGEVEGTLEAFKAYKGNYIIGDATALTLESIAGTTPIPYLAGIDGTDYGAGAWTATPTPMPEPTSGLLMLLGMGALALRRRRA